MKKEAKTFCIRDGPPIGRPASAVTKGSHLSGNDVVVLLKSLSILCVVAWSTLNIEGQRNSRPPAALIILTLVVFDLAVSLRNHFALDHLSTLVDQQAAFNKKQAEAIEHKIETSSNNSEAANRALVYFGAPIFSPLPVDNTPNEFRIKVPVGNSGNISTGSLSFEMNCYILSVSADNTDPMVAFKAVLGPHVVLSPTACRLTLGDGGNVTDGRGQTSKSVLVEGRALYTDPLKPGVHHETRFAYEVDDFKSNAGVNGLRAMTDVWDINNCTDDECLKYSWP